MVVSGTCFGATSGGALLGSAIDRLGMDETRLGRRNHYQDEHSMAFF